MSTGLRIQIRKELRALLPWWVAAVVAVVAAFALDRFWGPRWYSQTTIILLYVVGMLSLGSLSTGLEFSHRTLDALLAQPASRLRLLGIKFLVLGPLVVSLAAVAFATIGTYPLFREIPILRSVLLWMPIFISLLLAPWLAMVFREPLAAVIFGAAAPTVLLMSGQLALGRRPALTAMTLMWQGSLALSVVGAGMTWRRWLTLEAVDGPRVHVSLPAWLRRRTGEDLYTKPPRGRIGLLVTKELRLQQMTAAVSIFYVVAWIGLVEARRWVPTFLGPDLSSISLLHAGLIAVIAGSLASAEEQHYSTATWHTLMPMAAWKQWALKVGVTVAVVAVLALGLPWVLAQVEPSAERYRLQTGPVVGLLLLTLASLYVSSLCTSGVRAILTAFAAIPGTLLIATSLLDPLNRVYAVILEPLARWVQPFVELDRRTTIDGTAYAAAAVFAILLIRFGHLNHKSSDDPGEVWRQLGWLTVFFLAFTLVMRIPVALEIAGRMAGRG